MTGTAFLLHDFKSINGRSVAFGGNPVGGKITGQGTVKSGNLSFEKLNFVEQLNFNLLSVSQICDKEFSTHFTKSECIIVKPGFKIPDEWVLMRTPRRNHVYVMDLNSSTEPKHETCFI